MQTNHQTGKSYQESFLRLSGVFLQHSQLPIQTGIDIVREYMYQGKIKFFSSCTKLKEEASKYTYREATSTRGIDDVPIDKFNHLMDCLRYIAVRSSC